MTVTRKTISAIAATVMCLLMMVASNTATADQIKVLDVDAWGTGGDGGPFEIQDVSLGFGAEGLGMHGAASDAWISFCLELNEFIWNGGVFDVVLNTAADAGGLGGGNPDPLDARTAFLYSNFMSGKINDLLVSRFGGLAINFDYENTDGGIDESGRDMQNAIWKLEEEIATNYDNTTLTGQLLTIADEAVNSGAWVGLGNVRVLNVTQNGNRHQDLLVTVPTPAAVWSGLALFGGLATVHRARRRA